MPTLENEYRDMLGSMMETENSLSWCLVPPAFLDLRWPCSRGWLELLSFFVPPLEWKDWEKPELGLARDMISLYPDGDKYLLFWSLLGPKPSCPECQSCLPFYISFSSLVFKCIYLVYESAMSLGSHFQIFCQSFCVCKAEGIVEDGFTEAS